MAGFGGTIVGVGLVLCVMGIAFERELWLMAPGSVLVGAGLVLTYGYGGAG